MLGLVKCILIFNNSTRKFLEDNSDFLLTRHLLDCTKVVITYNGLYLQKIGEDLTFTPGFAFKNMNFEISLDENLNHIISFEDYCLSNGLSVSTCDFEHYTSFSLYYKVLGNDYTFGDYFETL